MDVSVLHHKDAGVACDQCGYPRRGLEVGTRCPECGLLPVELPPKQRGLPSLTLDQQGQIRLVALGLALLLYASFYSMQLAIVMQYEQLSLHAINLPSPKIAAVTLVQREIGGRPGYWGTMGWTCVLFQLVATYLITVPRLRNGFAEPILSLRRACRWTSLICVAALMGFMLSHGQGFIPLLSWYTWDLLLYALVLGEIPTNLLLYLYLGRLADRYRLPRAARTIRWLAWIGLGARLACVGVLVYPFPSHAIRNDAQAIALAALACFAIPAGVVGWAAIVGLTLRAARLGYVKPARRLAALVRDRAPVVRALLRTLERTGPRVCLVVGLALWLLAVSGQFSTAVGSYPGRQGLGGELPLLNYAGPKISAEWLASPGYYWRYTSTTIDGAALVMIVFLLTTRQPGQTPLDDRLRLGVRWATMTMMGLRIGLLMTVPTEGIRESYLRVAHIVAIEAPATAAMLYYLSRVARLELLPSIARQLRYWAWITPVLILAPLSLHLWSASTRGNWNTWQIGLIGALYGVTSLCCGALGVKMLAQLAWQIARPIWSTASAPAPLERPLTQPAA